MGWRDDYKVHPSAEKFPINEDGLADLGEDIKANSLQVPIVFWRDEDDDQEWLLDGRRRLTAMERAGIPVAGWNKLHLCGGDPVAIIIGLNIHRRHLSKLEVAHLIVAAVKAGESFPRQVGEEIEKRVKGRPSNPVKAKAVALGKAQTRPLSERTIERALAETKADGTEPKPADKHGGLVVEIRRHLHNARKAELAACRKLYELRHRLEAQGKDWWEFYEAAYISSRKEAERLMQIEGEDHCYGGLQKVEI